MLVSLKKISNPNKYIKRVETFNGDFNAVFKVGKEEIIIECRNIVKKGDNLIPFFAI